MELTATTSPSPPRFFYGLPCPRFYPPRLVSSLLLASSPSLSLLQNRKSSTRYLLDKRPPRQHTRPHFNSQACIADTVTKQWNPPEPRRPPRLPPLLPHHSLPCFTTSNSAPRIAIPASQELPTAHLSSDPTLYIPMQSSSDIPRGRGNGPRKWSPGVGRVPKLPEGC